MFLISMPLTFKIGETADCRINGEPKWLTWRDKDALVIQPDDIRQIVEVTHDVINFICEDRDENAKEKGPSTLNRLNEVFADLCKTELALAKIKATMVSLMRDKQEEAAKNKQ